MSEMSPEARALLDSAIPGLEPDGDVRARVRAGVAARIAVSIAAGAAVAAASKSTAAAAGAAGAAGVGASAAGAAGAAGAGVGAGAGAATAGAAVTIGVTTKVIASLAVVSAVSVGTITYTQTKKAETRAATTMVAAPTYRPAPPVAPRKTAAADAVDPVAPPNVAPVPDPSIPVVAVAPTTAPLIPTPPILPAPASSATLAAEVTLLRQANAEIAAGNSLKALALLDDHRRLYPRGALVEERDAARVLALCGAGRHSEGITARSRFLRNHPASPQAPRVQNACATSGSGIQRDFPQ